MTKPNRPHPTHRPAMLFTLAGLVAGSSAIAQPKAVPVPPDKSAQPVNVPKQPNQPGRNFPNNAPVNQPGNQPNTPNKGRPNPNAPVTNPGKGGGEETGEGHHEVPHIDAGDDMVEFSGFAEAVDLTTLVEIVAQTLKINVYSDPNLSGSIVFNAPVKVKKDQLLDLLRAWLELNNYTIVFDKRTQFYAVIPASKVEMEIDGLTTKVFVTEGIRPSSLKSMIDGLIGSGGSSVIGGAGGAKGGNRGQPQQPMGFDDNGNPIPQQPPGGGGGGGGSGGKIVYNDDLGMIIMTDTTRRIEQVTLVIDKVVEEYRKYKVTELPLEFVAPGVARQRILEMLGQAPQSANRQNNRGGFDEYGNPMQQQPQQQQANRATMDNLAERLTVSPNGNSLFFRGRDEELDHVKALVAKIDAPGRLIPKPYTVGASAKAVADIARQRGMGEVTTIRSEAETRQSAQFYDPYQFQRQNQNQTQQLTGGPVMVVDEGRGQIIYYATDKLHEEMARLIKEIAPEDDAIVMREYRLTHAKSDKVAEIINGLINNQTPAGSNESSLLPSGPGRNNQPIIVTPPYYGGPGNDLSISGKNSFVIADEANNQVIVKAPLKEQLYYRDLINRLDLPVPQVYVEAQIVAVTGSDDFRLAFETQLINANGTGGIVNTNFGLTDANASGYLGRRNVRSGLKGVTSALIKSDQVPIVMNALQTTTESRVLSRPNLLVDANTEEASVESKDEEPTSTISEDDTGVSRTSFGGYEEAGTKLIVKKPQISPGDAIRMEIEVELSSFIGAGTNDLPPPKQTNNIKSQVQVPANMTVVIGGVVIDAKRDTIDKIPLLGDIPIIGALFSDTNKTKNKTTLYVFLTPRIQRDPKFRDASLFTRIPLKDAGLDPDLPPMEPVLVDFIEVREHKPGTASSTPAPAPIPVTPPAAPAASQPAPEGAR